MNACMWHSFFPTFVVVVVYVVVVLGREHTAVCFLLFLFGALWSCLAVVVAKRRFARVILIFSSHTPKILSRDPESGSLFLSF